MPPGGEFEHIRDNLRPLTAGDPAALDLLDDAAVLIPPDGMDLVLASDMLVEGVHFLATDSMPVVAARAMGSNLSDLAAMGAVPRGYLCAVAWPDTATDAQRAEFAKTLGDLGQAAGLSLLGGDTTRSSDGLVVSMTMLGLVPNGQALTRKGACPGDDIWVSGTIGDAALGLDMARGSLDGQDFLRARYDAPQARLALGAGLQGLASACIDISDGLVADAGHICTASGVGMALEAAMIPVSDPVLLWLEKEGEPGLLRLLTAGDDYELLFTAPHAHADKILALQAETGAQISWIGQVDDGEGVDLRGEDGGSIVIDTPGFTHF